MPIVRTITPPVKAILCSDLHLSMKVPVARSEEVSWWSAMDRVLSQLRELVERHQAIVVFAGDVFDTWNVPPELINWALEKLPHLHAIPGNHDLPYHQGNLAYRSAYGTLVRAGKITELTSWPLIHNGIAFYGCPFGEEIPERIQEHHGPLLHVLVLHEYIWIPGCGHRDAPEEAKLARMSNRFSQFDVVVCGDNHMGFQNKLPGGPRVVNCGTMMRRKTNEHDYVPCVWLLHASGSVTAHPLDTRGEVLSRVPKEAQDQEDWQEITEFVQELEKLGVTPLDFREALLQTMKTRHVRTEVRKLIIEAMGA